jgi:small nuclear ribonucleoprotein F
VTDNVGPLEKCKFISSFLLKRKEAMSKIEMVHVLNPKPFLWHCIGTRVRVKLKWNIEYRGTLQSTDEYFNLHLAEAVEISEKETPVGDVVIRCNNVLYLCRAQS